jgi:catecholate siderophore receptor
MWHDAKAPGRDVVEESRWAVAPSLGLGLGTPTRLIASYYHMEQDNVPDYGIPWVPAGNTNATLSRYINKAPPVDFDNFYGTEGYDFEDVITRMGTLKIEHEFSPALTLRNTSRYGRTYRNSAITAPRFLDLNPGAAVESDRFVFRQLQRRELDHTLWANVTDANIEFPTGPIDHEIVAGFEALREDQDNRNSAQSTNQFLTDIFNPTPQDPPLGPMPPITGVPSEVTAITLAPYLFETLKLTEQWQLNGGVRFDHVESDFSTTTTNLSRTDNLLSWRAGLVYKPRPNGSIYFGYGTSFNPSIEGAAGLALATNTYNLKPEETRTYELGTKWELFKQRALLSAAVFRTEKFNTRTPGLNPGDPSLVLDGEQVVHGVELNAAGQITKDWRVIAGYTYLHTEVEESNTASDEGSQFSNSPKHSASLWTTYTLPWHLEIGGGAQYVGERLNNLSSNAAVREAPDYWLFDAMLSYAATKNLTLRLNVYNLADERYIDRVGGGHFVPGAGRSATLTAALAF